MDCGHSPGPSRFAQRNITRARLAHEPVLEAPELEHARRIDCAFLAKLVAEHRLDEDEASEIALKLAYRLPKRAYRL